MFSILYCHRSYQPYFLHIWHVASRLGGLFVIDKGVGLLGRLWVQVLFLYLTWPLSVWFSLWVVRSKNKAGGGCFWGSRWSLHVWTVVSTHSSLWPFWYGMKPGMERDGITSQLGMGTRISNPYIFTDWNRILRSLRRVSLHLAYWLFWRNIFFKVRGQNIPILFKTLLTFLATSNIQPYHRGPSIFTLVLDSADGGSRSMRKSQGLRKKSRSWCLTSLVRHEHRCLNQNGAFNQSQFHSLWDSL